MKDSTAFGQSPALAASIPALKASFNSFRPFIFSACVFDRLFQSSLLLRGHLALQVVGDLARLDGLLHLRLLGGVLLVTRPSNRN